MKHKTTQMPAHYWREIINTCRTSGLSDHLWCMQNNIAPSTFYKYAKKFREQACQLPVASGKQQSHVQQEVVQLNSEQLSPCNEVYTTMEQNASSSDCPAIHLHINGVRMDINNHADAALLSKVFSALNNSGDFHSSAFGERLC